jgi:predicted RNase H-like nuclease (RuvC/YqgF family)
MEEARKNFQFELETLVHKVEGAEREGRSAQDDLESQIKEQEQEHGEKLAKLQAKLDKEQASTLTLKQQLAELKLNCKFHPHALCPCCLTSDSTRVNSLENLLAEVNRKVQVLSMYLPFLGKRHGNEQSSVKA